MKLLSIFLLLLSFNLFAIEDEDFSRVSWKYEVFEEGEGAESFGVLYKSENLSSRPYTNAKIKLPLKGIDCSVNEPQSSVKDEKTKFIHRAVTCTVKNSQGISLSYWTKCGPKKKENSSTNEIYGKYCEGKKCYSKGFRVVISCSSK